MENLYAKTEEAVFFPEGSDPATLRVGSPSIFLGWEEEGTSANILDNLFIYLLRIHSTTLQANKLTLLLKKKCCGEGDNQKRHCAILGMPPLFKIYENIEIEI